jgi:hypothetical protein
MRFAIIADTSSKADAATQEPFASGLDFGPSIARLHIYYPPIRNCEEYAPMINEKTNLKRRDLLLTGGSLLAISALSSGMAKSAKAQAQGKPNILVIFGDDIGFWNISAYNNGMMGYHTPSAQTRDSLQCTHPSKNRSVRDAPINGQPTWG